MSTPTTTATPPASGRWAPGRSGNPNGRPRNLTKAHAEAARHVPAILARLVQAAERGDVEAARVVLEYVRRGPDAPLPT